MAKDEDETRDPNNSEARPVERGSVPVASIGSEPEEDAPPRRRNDPVPDLQLVDMPLEALRPAARRVRRASKAQVARIRRSSATFGLVRPVLITRKDEIVDGHEVLEALRQIGVERAP